MELSDIIEHVLSTLQGLQLNQVALLAGVTIVTACIVYLLVDALRYRAIPELNVPLTAGVYSLLRSRQLCGHSSKALTAMGGLLLYKEVGSSQLHRGM
jgi:hypothetical protein